MSLPIGLDLNTSRVLAAICACPRVPPLPHEPPKPWTERADGLVYPTMQAMRWYASLAFDERQRLIADGVELIRAAAANREPNIAEEPAGLWGSE